jgi:predicted DNA-binding protein YlxM (UPF0122 family)
MKIDLKQLSQNGNVSINLSAKDLLSFAHTLLAEKQKLMEENILRMQTEKYYTTKEVQKTFKVSRQTIFQWQKQGFIKAQKISKNKNLWLHSDIVKMMFVKH